MPDPGSDASFHEAGYENLSPALVPEYCVSCGEDAVVCVGGAVKIGTFAL